MVQIGNEKILGGLGALFIVLSFIPYVGWILGVAGVVLLMIALNKFSQIFDDKKIFSNFLIGFLISLAGIVIAIIFGIFSFLPLLSERGGYRSFESPSMVGILLAVAVMYILTVVSCYYYRQSFNLLYSYTNVNLFKVAGTFLFWGAVALIVFGLGGLGILVGWILLAVAFFTLPTTYEFINKID
ncbi:MAG: DUF996 domain-containing protein [Thermodesulfovibrio sp.]|nr:DUF996 domain-containing protein [Thermodesulfovibrio sp.]